MIQYIYQHELWPAFSWHTDRINPLLVNVRSRLGRILGRMEVLGFDLRNEAALGALTLEIIKSNEIEGDTLKTDEVRSSIARRLGLKIPGLVDSGRHVDGVVEMMLDATQKYDEPLTEDRLFGWHACMFPTGRSGMYKITVGGWRTGAMQVVSGGMGRENVHFEAPGPSALPQEMKLFLSWFNEISGIDPVVKAGIAHFWFVTVHPFEDGNGRIARAIADLQLARADGSPQRFYSMSAQIQKERNAYYDILETSQKASPDITRWLEWFLSCLQRALLATDDILATVLAKATFWHTHAQASLNARQNLMLNKMLDGFDGKVTAAKWGKITKCSHDTALRDIQQLITMNVLRKEEAGGRSTSYVIDHSSPHT
ncbi:MAG: Fic family protein [Bacteroidota bacterium]